MIVSFVPKIVKVAKQLQLSDAFRPSSILLDSKLPRPKRSLETSYLAPGPATRQRCVPRPHGRRTKEHPRSEGCDSRLFWANFRGAKATSWILSYTWSFPLRTKQTVFSKWIANFRHANCSSLRLGRLQNQRCNESIWLLMTFLCAQRNANMSGVCSPLHIPNPVCYSTRAWSPTEKRFLSQIFEID